MLFLKKMHHIASKKIIMFDFSFASLISLGTPTRELKNLDHKPRSSGYGPPPS